MAVSAVLRPAIAAREAPKSIRVGLPASSSRMLAGLMSRCRKPALWTCSSPSSSGHRMRSISSGCSGPVRLQPAFQGLAVQQLHDDIGGAVGLEKIEHPHDGGRVLQAGQRAALGDEALAAPGEILGGTGRARQHGRAVLPHGKRQRQIFLDGDLAAELAVARAIGDAEAALSQDGDDLVAPDHPSRRQRDEIDRRRDTLGLAARVAHPPPPAREAATRPIAGQRPTRSKTLSAVPLWIRPKPASDRMNRRPCRRSSSRSSSGRSWSP